MNLILLFEADFVDSTRARARLEGRRARHVRKVLRADVGDRLCVGLLGGDVGEARVARLSHGHVELDDVVLDEKPPDPLDVIVVLALPRPPVLRRSLAALTTFGVKQVEIVDAARVEQSFWQSHAISEDALLEQVFLGLEQARDTRPPPVRLHRRLGAFVDDALGDLVKGRASWVADPRGVAPADAGLRPPSLLAIGPEGGWVERELADFGRAGLRPVALGQRILRVETAVGALLGRHL